MNVLVNFIPCPIVGDKYFTVSKQVDFHENEKIIKDNLISYTLIVSEEQLFALNAIEDYAKALNYCEIILKNLKQPKSNIKQTYLNSLSSDLIKTVNGITNTTRYYYEFDIPKTDGKGNVIGKRRISAPEKWLKQIQKQIVYYLRDVKQIKESPFAYAYVKGRSYNNAAEKHAQTENVFYAYTDIEHFFPSITAKMLRKTLERYDLTKQEISTIVKASTYYNEKYEKWCLPQGAPTSPFLSNIVFYTIDYDIVNMLETEFGGNIEFTRYSDDMTFSCPHKFKKQRFIEKLTKVLRPYGLKLKQSKTKFTTVYGKNRVTGLTVNKKFDVTVGYRRKKSDKMRINKIISQILAGERPKKEIYALRGELSYLHSIEPDYLDYILSKYSKKFSVDISDLLNEHIT